ncbi:MAG: hypothetical protein JW819_00770 [Candidatus Krumholzibacteriota bacterium]|nr:hypothetical protein [Candidatus Krumholzibacteriota bacterium]
MRRWFLSLSGGALASKILGLGREILLARWFGTGPVADAYRGSLTATLSPVHLLTNRLVQTCFIPLYATHRRASPERARALFLLLLAFFVVLGLLLGVLLFQLAGPLVGLLLPGFDAGRRELAAAMLRIMALGVPPYLYVSLLGSLGAAQEDFAIPSLRPGLQNLGMLALIAAAALTGRPVLAAWGFSGSYAVLALAATLLVWRRNEWPPRAALDGASLRAMGGELWRLFRPLLVVSALAELQILAERFLASLVGAGSVAAMEYARFITETSHTLLIVPLGLIGLGHFATLSPTALGAKTDRTLARIWLALLPLSAFLVLNGDGVLRLLYLRGRFDLDSLAITGRALAGLGVGLWAFSASWFLQRVFNARLANMTVLRGESLFALASLATMALLYRPLGVLGLALGPSAGGLAGLAYYLRRLPGPLPDARRSFLLVLAVLPGYCVLSWLLGRAAAGAAGLALQVLLALLWWGGWVLGRRELRGLLR